ncbi:uncharacterized protein BDW70DRAFT_127337 [Aspergillus foveolatus]|uniref:uncharacterized protein n=1 Tax=Aspergillus foveolatus TaxID=210207 RepID=UPI003CCCB3D8
MRRRHSLLSISNYRLPLACRLVAYLGPNLAQIIYYESPQPNSENPLCAHFGLVKMQKNRDAELLLVNCPVALLSGGHTHAFSAVEKDVIYTGCVLRSHTPLLRHVPPSWVPRW